MTIISIASIVLNVLLWKAAERQMALLEIYQDWISEWRGHVLRTWAHMKMLDDKQMFQKDDEVGVVFEDMKLLIQDLNDKTEETIEEE